jgi:glucose/arabinose dehydrogenase
MLIRPSGELLLTESSREGSVRVLTNNGKTRNKLIEGLARPYGLAIWKDYLYAGEPTSIKRYKYHSKALAVGAAEEVIKYPEMGQGHWTRSLLFDAKGEKLYVGVGTLRTCIRGATWSRWRGRVTRRRERTEGDISISGDRPLQ